MDWVGIVLAVVGPFVTPLLNPRRIAPRGELGKAMKHVGRRGRKEVLVVFARLESGDVPAFVGGYSLVVVWVVGLRRLVPTRRDSTDRLLTTYRANVLLAEKTGPGAFDRVRFGTP
jgi:hypothetical protein